VIRISKLVSRISTGGSQSRRQLNQPSARRMAVQSFGAIEQFLALAATIFALGIIY
jgi:hypothetical protein